MTEGRLVERKEEIREGRKDRRKDPQRDPFHVGRR